MQCIWLQFLATHVQRDLVAFSIYGYDVQETNDDAIPDDVAEKILRFARSAVAAGWMKNKAYAIGFYRKVRRLLRDRLMQEAAWLWGEYPSTAVGDWRPPV